MPVTLEDWVERAASLHLILEKARAQADQAQKIINATINDYITAKNHISSLTDEMVRKAAEKLKS